MFYLMDSIEGVRKLRGECEVIISRLGFYEPNRIWEPLATMIEDVPGMVEDYMTSEERNLKHEILNLYF